MKILVLNGSPKVNSDTFILTNSFLKGINKNQSNEIEIIHVIEKKIKPCLGCFRCWATNKGRCIQNDDLNDILDKIIASDVIIWSFPLYFYSMPSHLKAVLDRTLPFYKLNMKQDNDKVIHESKVDVSKKINIVISGCGFPNWKGNFDALKMMCQNCMANPYFIFVPETQMINNIDCIDLSSKVLSNLKKAGEEFSLTRNIKSSTIEQIEVPMISNEQYIEIVNHVKL